MSRGGWVAKVVLGLMALSMVTLPGFTQAELCHLAPQHAGVTFPVERVDPAWTCRLAAIVDHYTTANKIGPLRAALTETTYIYLLDRPPFAAALVNRLDLAPYKAEKRGPGLWWGNDGEGTEGTVRLVYQDRTSRVYYLEGTHHSRLLPNLTGKAVVFLRMGPVKDTDGFESMDSTMISYTKLDNRILSGLASLLRPLIGGVVSRKLAKGVDVVNKLGITMRQHPERVLFEATDPPAFSDEDVAFLNEAVGIRQPPASAHPTPTKP